MKILLVADIHANWPALQAIRESFDACLCLGDIVEYGVDPIPCINWVRQHATHAIRGNHDHAVAQRVTPAHGSPFRELAAETRELHWQLLQPTHFKFLSQLPVTSLLHLDGKSFFLVHATPRDPMDEYVDGDPERWERRLEGITADYICVGHSHLQFHLQFGAQHVINPGSVGQPRDGDPRAAYAVIENGEVSLRRVAYDLEVAIDQLENSGMSRQAITFASDVLRSGGNSAALL